MAHSDADLWTCPKCGEKFTGRNMAHSCGRYKLDDLFARSDPQIRKTYDAFEHMALQIAPFHVIPQKTRFCYQLRMRCVNGTVGKTYLRIGFVLPHIVIHPRIEGVQTFSPILHLHNVRLCSPEDVDALIAEWLQLSTVCGEQRHLRR